MMRAKYNGNLGDSPTQSGQTYAEIVKATEQEELASAETDTTPLRIVADHPDTPDDADDGTK